MRFSTSTLLTTLALFSLSSARIIGLQAPSVINHGIPFNISLLTEDYIQSVEDVAFASGITLGPGYTGSLGLYILANKSLKKYSNLNVTLDFEVEVPETLGNGTATIAASVLSLYGASYMPSLVEWNVTVTVGGVDDGSVVTSRT